MLILSAITFSISLLFLCKKYVYIFQQNSYKQKNFLLNLQSVNLFMLADLACVVYTIFALIFNLHELFLLICAAQNIILCFLHRPKKIKLKVTNRIKRLYFFIAIIILPFAIFVPAKFLLFLQIIVLPLFLVATYAVLPLEKYFKQKFIAKAVLKLKTFSNLKIIGITGSYGKTTAKNILYNLLCKNFNCVKTPKNFNTELGAAMTILNELTPETQIFICEMGAKKRGDIAKLCKICPPDYSIITGISLCHIAEFGSLENIKKGKFELCENTKEFCVFNIDENSTELYENCKISKTSVGNFAEIKFESGAGKKFSLLINGKQTEYETNLAGEHIKINSALAIVAALYLDVSEETIQSQLLCLPQIDNRLQIIKTNGIKILDNSYNSNPESAKNSLRLLSEQTGRKIAVVCGMVELGKYQFDENKKLGKLCKEVCDYVFVVGKTNREAILQGLDGFEKEKIICFANLEEVKTHFSNFLQYGDNILFENDLPDNYK